MRAIRGLYVAICAVAVAMAAVLCCASAFDAVGPGLSAGLAAGTTAIGQGIGVGCAGLLFLTGAAVVVLAAQLRGALRDQARPALGPPPVRRMARGAVIDSHAIELHYEEEP